MSETILQFKVDFTRNQRLNPMVKKPLDCGANTLYLLGILNLSDALDLSDLQNACVPGKDKYLQYSYLFKKYLFTDKTKIYSGYQCKQDELIEACEQLKDGYGTIIYMEAPIIGHYVCIFKMKGEIKIADLQKGLIIETHELTRYLSHYETFLIPMVETKGGRRKTRRKTRKN